MEITIKKTIDREILENIFVTALEGGSNYWYDLRESSIALAFANSSEDKALSERIFEAIYDKGIDIHIYDAEDPEERLGTLSRTTMQERLQKLSESPHSWALNNELEENGDAESSDVVFQYLIMEDIVFG